MKRPVLLLFSLALTFCLFAQPANDDCTTAQNLGSLPVPAACPGGQGQPIVVNGTNVGATAANPYTYLTNCNPSGGGTSMSVPANDVWYQFTSTGYNITIDITSTFATPNIALWQGTCGDLGGRGCATGNAGSTTLFVDQLVPGNTYYIQVSGFDVEEGNFTLTINNNINCDNCMLLSSLTATPPPVNGMYQPGQNVQFCYHVDQYAEVNTNWLHGVQIDFGPGWNTGSLVPTPAASYDQQGVWAWYPTDIIDNQGNTWPAGFYYDRNGEPLGGGTASDGDPGNNFGDHIPDNINADQNPYAIPANIWNFCWTISVADICVPGANLGMTINTSGDGESGSWSNNGCNSDPVYVFQAVTSCCPPTMATQPAGCDATDGTATATPVGNVGPYNYVWYNNGGTAIQTNNAVAGAQSISNLAGGNYSVHITDANNCLQVVNFTIGGGGNAGTPVLGSNSPTCEGQNLQLNAGPIPGAQYFWTGPNSFTANTQNPVLPAVTAAQQGQYSCYVVVAGCTSGTANINVVITPGPEADFTVGPPVCVGGNIAVTYTGNAPANSTFNWNFSGGTILSGVGAGPYNISWAAPGNHAVTLTVSLNGCSATHAENAFVEALPVPGFRINPNTVSIDDPTIEVTDQSTGAVSWQYSISDGGSASVPSFGYSFDEVGTYYITQTVSNNLGCTAQLTQDVVVEPVSTIFIPNAFTPGNNDNSNDNWGVIANNITDFQLMVFNRWGELVFSSMDQDVKWNGTLNNKRQTPAKQDVYVYKIWYTDAKGIDKTHIGHVTIVR